MTELLPCPFCGGEARLDTSGPRIAGRWVYCCGCGAVGGLRMTEAEAVAAWNTRSAYEDDRFFYLPKPKRDIGAALQPRIVSANDDFTKLKVEQDYKVFDDAVREWTNSIDRKIVERICEVWMGENTRAERTCRIEYHYGEWYCSGCGKMVGTRETASELYVDGNFIEMWSYCPNCGARVMEVKQ